MSWRHTYFFFSCLDDKSKRAKTTLSGEKRYKTLIFFSLVYMRRHFCFVTHYFDFCRLSIAAIRPATTRNVSELNHNHSRPLHHHCCCCCCCCIIIAAILSVMILCDSMVYLSRMADISLTSLRRGCRSQDSPLILPRSEKHLRYLALTAERTFSAA